MTRPSRHAVLRLVLLLAALSYVAQAAPATVVRSSDVEAVYAERVALPLRLEIGATELGVLAATPTGAGGAAQAPVCVEDAPTGLPAGGAASCAAEMSEANPLAWARVAPGNRTYTVLVRERFAEAVPAGAAFDVALAIDGVPVATVRIAQVVSDPLVAEGARVMFDVGRAQLAAPSFVVKVSAVVEDAGTTVLEAITDVDLNFRWRGDGGDIEGKINPALSGTVGVAMTFRIVHADPTTETAHNLRIKDASGAVVAGPTADIEPSSPTATLLWTPAAPGAYRYECRYHGATQSGTIQVTEGT